jgi:Putative transposase/Transposase zinc-binding domain
MSILADWLAGQAAAWLAGRHGPLPPQQRRALSAILRCRTPALGGRVYRCTDCAGHDYAYHSCHHRACPRCGSADAAAWTRAQEEKLLPVPYYFWTFTVPDTLRAAFVAQAKVLHDLLFAQAFAALQTVARRKNVLGAEIAAVAVLHTWGRQLQHHPHVHLIVPGGGLRADGGRWMKCRSADWFLPVKAVAAAFRSGLEAALRAARPDLHAAVPDSTWRAGWNVDVQAAGTGREVVRYLARYVKRTTISDERIIEADDTTVRFGYTDSTSGQRKECVLSAEDFMRRYLRHVLPPGQHRVRYFGWLHPAAWRRRMRVETLLAKVIVVRAQTEAKPDAPQRCCPHCGKAALILIGLLARAPP